MSGHSISEKFPTRSRARATLGSLYLGEASGPASEKPGVSRVKGMDRMSQPSTSLAKLTFEPRSVVDWEFGIRTV
jgi:hypothetical protein